MSRTARLLLVSTILCAAPLQAQFGSYAVVDGHQIYVTAIDADRPSSVLIYERTSTGWVETDVLRAPEMPGHEGDDYFGRFVIRDGETLLVGSTALDLDADTNSDGGVFLFRRDGGGWMYDSFLRPESVPHGVSFGRFAALRDGILLVSALGASDSRGAIWVFERDGAGAWTHTHKLEPEGAPQGEFFGWGLAFDGERAITGALQQGRPTSAAYVFRRAPDGSWVQEAMLESGEDYQNTGFAQSVAWLDGRALVGAPFADRGRGAVVIYERDADTGEWDETGMLTAYDRQQGGQFGAALVHTSGRLWVGAPGTDGSGRVYGFEYDATTGRFGDATKLAGLEQEPGDAFGSFVAFDEDHALIGQQGDDNQLGSAIVLERAGAGWSPTAKLLGPDPTALAALTAGEISCDDGQADQFTCSQIDIVSFLPVADIGGVRGTQTNDVWGWTDPQTGREYALVGRTDGTSFIDITNAESPVFLGDLPKTAGSQSNAWRDIKVYDNHAFIVADGAGQHGMQVFDLTRLRDVRDAPVTFDEDAMYDEIASAHNIVINEQTGYAYAVGVNSGGETCGGGLHMINIQEPLNPLFEGCFQDPNTGSAGTGYSHDAMCINYDGPDTEHAGKEICFGSNENSLSIADVSDKESPLALSHASYPNVAYAHQGWITEDHRYFYMNDEGDEGNAANDSTFNLPGTRTLIWDVSDLDDPVMVKEHFGETLTIDHNLYIKDDLMYQSNYVSGLRVLDISDPENPEEVGFLDTVPWSEGVSFDGSWSNYPFFESGTIVVSSGKEGVFFVKYRRPELVP